MKKTLLFLTSLLTFATIQAANSTVTVVFNGTTATVTIPADLASSVTCSSGTSSHVKLIQAETVSSEIDYVLSGNSDDGEFYMEGSFKATVKLNGLTLTNPNGPAINVQNGKRIKLNLPDGTTNTLTDGANDTANGCFNCKGHTEVTGKGTLNIVGNSKHGFYSKEYITFKNATLNITAAPKDGIHCKEYFLLEKGTINISGAKDDGIQVELDGTTSTGITTDHEDEDTGNFYMEAGTLTITGYEEGKAIKADGTITFKSGTQNFNTADIQENAASGISGIQADSSDSEVIYDLRGRQMQNGTTLPKGIYLIRNGKTTKKVIVR
jgi:hypothetical protein